MTRFARAKGSKASNEKQPEEATLWRDMRSAMLSNYSASHKNIEEKKNVIDCKQAKWTAFDKEQSSLLVNQSLSSENLKKKNQLKDKTNLKKQLSLESNHIQDKIKVPKEKSQSFESNIEKKCIISEGNKRKLQGTDENVKKRKKNDDNLKEPINKKIKPEYSKSVCSNEKLKLEAVFKMKKQREKIQKQPKLNKKNNKQNNEFSKWRGQNKRFPNQNFDKFLNTKNHFNKSFLQGTSVIEEIIVNGEKIPVVKFQGFPVTKEDSERLMKLRSDMIKEGIPKDQMESAIKLERRRAEKALSRLKKALCFHCRGSGHLLSNCPALVEKTDSATGICYKCGSTEHSAFDCKVIKGSIFQFAECFICKEQGHIAKQCPDNPKGLYPQGGACRECGDVTHLRKDCPQKQFKKTEVSVTVGVRDNRNLESLEDEVFQKEMLNKKSKKLIVKF